MGMLEKRMNRPNPLEIVDMPISTSRKEESDGIVIGSLGMRECRIPVSRFAQHMVITGQPGMRKTTLAVHLIKQLAGSGISVVVFEPAKTEYADLLQDGKAVITYGDDGLPSTMRLAVNSFAVDRGVRPSVWIEDVANAIVDAFGMGDQPLPLHLESLIRRLYRLRGISLASVVQNEANWPTVRDFLAQIDPYINQETCSGKEVQQNVRGALVRRGRSMAEVPALGAPRGIMASDLVDSGGVKILQLSDIGPNSGLFVGMVLLLRIIRTARTLGRRPLHTVVVLEEAHSLLIDALTGKPTMFSRVYETALAELRSAGIGFITIDQRPSLLPSGVLANSVTQIAFASTHGADRSAVGAALGLVDNQVRRLGGLHEGEALFSSVGDDGAGIINLRSERS